MNLFRNFNRKSNNIINNKENINFCKNCKYILPDSFFIPNNDFAKCALYNKIKNDENYLVTGKIKKENIEYTYCSIARNDENMCGQEGKDFISKFNKL
jgi:hypothetical protein